jgi:hypothetical protein
LAKIDEMKLPILWIAPLKLDLGGVHDFGGAIFIL